MAATFHELHCLMHEQLVHLCDHTEAVNPLETNANMLAQDRVRPLTWAKYSSPGGHPAGMTEAGIAPGI